MFHADLNRTLVVAADLLNTADGLRSGSPSPEELTTVESLRSFISEREVPQWPVGRLDRAQLARVTALRGALEQLWSRTPLEAAQDLADLNGLLEGVGVELTAGEGAESEIRAVPVPVSRELADVMTAHIAYALSQLVILDESARLRTCRGEDCEAKIVDLTRNRSKLFCDFGNCANRAHVRAYRARKAAEREAARRDDTGGKGGKGSGKSGGAAKTATAEGERLAKPSAKDKAAQLEEPTSESAVAAKEFRSRMRDELMESRDKQEKKKGKTKKKKKDDKKDSKKDGKKPKDKKKSSK